MNRISISGLLIVLVFLCPLFTFAAASSDAPRMSKEELRSRLGNQNIVVIDVRTGRDWEESGSKVKGAVREDPQDAAGWAGKYTKEKTIVLYCS